VTLRLASGLLCCLTFVVFGQDDPQQPTPPPQPPQQQPPAAPGTPPTPKPTVELPPVPPGQPSKAPPPERDTGGDVLSIAPLYWYTTAQPRLRQGSGSTVTTVTLPGSLDFTGNKNYAIGGILTLPTGHENSLQFSYFRKQSQGNTVLKADSSFFGNPFAAGDIIATHYTLQNIKISWNYLTYPYPSASAKFRVKTLWEVQYLTMHSVFDAPADTNAIATEGRKSIVLPTLGMGIEYHPAKHVLFEVKGSGFGIPGHSDIWDTEANLVIRAGRLELLAGGRAYHFKTSPKGDNYFSDTLYGPYAALRYIFR